MAVYTIVNAAGKYRDDDAIHDLLEYVTSKAHKENILGGAVLPEIAELSMKGLARSYHKDEGVRLRHSILSFDPGDSLTPHQVKDIAQQAIAYYQDDYQILAAIHDDQDHLHVHLVMNSVNYRDGSKYRGTKDDLYGFCGHINKVLNPYGVRAKYVKK